MIHIEEEEVWRRYLLVEDFNKSGMGRKEYSDAHNLIYKDFNNILYRMNYCKYSRPKEYPRLLALAREYNANPGQLTKFAAENKIAKIELSNAAVHANYLDIIEKLKKERGTENMNFIKINPKNIVTSLSNVEIETIYSEPSILTKVHEKKNDIQIMINSGIKVSISPDTDSSKIIKIIELLKDL